MGSSPWRRLPTRVFRVVHKAGDAMRIYTGQGDSGHTGLFGGNRVPKHHGRIEALGTVDELNTVVGWVLVAWHEASSHWATIQTTLFDIGAELATPADDKGVNVRLTDGHVGELEQLIDTLDADLAPLRRFVLPGGTECAARLHMARAVARRAERAVSALAAQEEVRPVVIRYLNRLSDLLFVAARWANKQAGVEDVPYIAAATPDTESE